MNEEINKTENHKEKVHFVANRQMELYLQIIAISSSIIVITIMFLLMYYIRQVLGVFVLSFLISYIISPLVKILERRKINRTLSVGILYLAFVAITVVCVVVFVPMLWNELITLQFSIQDNLSNPELGKNIMSSIEDFQEQLSEAIPILKDIDLKSQFDISNSVSNIASWILNYIGQMIKTITSYGTRIAWVIISIFVIPFIVFFLLKDGNKMKKVILRLVPSRYKEVSTDLLHLIDIRIGRFIRGKLAESIILSILTAIGLKILGIKYALLIGSIAGFANLIPYIGPVGIAIPPVLLAIYQYGIFQGVITAIFLSILQFIDNMILVPFIVGKSVDLHPLVTIFVVFIGGKTLGLLGLVAAVPMASIIISIAQAIYQEFKNISSMKSYYD
ncbi:TPA: AI-2E family transporter [Candidatus Poribacteria bacterium]|nr:AI-2E family transporter [Candidatus Poribacteria bacterium]